MTTLEVVVQDTIIVEVLSQSGAVIQTVCEDVQVFDVIQAGPQGPQGLPGLSIEGVSGTALEPISALRVVSFDGSGLRLTDPASDASTLAIRGVSIAATAQGQEAIVKPSGIIADPSLNWPSGTLLYPSAGGSLSPSYPSSGVLRAVAVSTGPGAILVSINDPIFIGA